VCLSYLRCHVPYYHYYYFTLLIVKIIITTRLFLILWSLEIARLLYYTTLIFIPIILLRLSWLIYAPENTVFPTILVLFPMPGELVLFSSERLCFSCIDKHAENILLFKRAHFHTYQGNESFSRKSL
jgi:hypothetical protein